MQWTQETDPFPMLNDRALLDDTPIGTLRVVPWANTASVAVMDKQDPSIVRSIIKTLHVGENPLDAVYGKRTHEHASWRAAYDARDESIAKADASEAKTRTQDLVTDLEKFRSRRDDGEEALAMQLGEIPWDVVN